MSGRRDDLDFLAAKLKAEGRSYRQIAQELGVAPSMARRRVIRYERLRRENSPPETKPKKKARR
jgi:transposase